MCLRLLESFLPTFTTTEVDTVFKHTEGGSTVVVAGTQVQHDNEAPHNHALGDSYLSNQIPIVETENTGVYLPNAANVSKRKA